jgi:NAD(P)-dependent dehydrogenase (short-subunit alcohol dehydrogenase family)
MSSCARNAFRRSDPGHEYFHSAHQRTPEQVAAVLPTFSALRPLGRNDQPVDAVEALLFLPSDQASFIAGVVLSVDGVMAGRQ